MSRLYAITAIALLALVAAPAKAQEEPIPELTYEQRTLITDIGNFCVARVTENLVATEAVQEIRTFHVIGPDGVVHVASRDEFLRAAAERCAYQIMEDEPTLAPLLVKVTPAVVG